MPSDESIEKSEPHYDLAVVQSAFAQRRFQVSPRVKRHLRAKRWTTSDVCSVVASITAPDFHKSQAHRDRPGVWLDIYRPRVRGVRMYVKVTENRVGVGFVVLSFCRDGEAH